MCKIWYNGDYHDYEAMQDEEINFCNLGPEYDTEQKCIDAAGSWTSQCGHVDGWTIFPCFTAFGGSEWVETSTCNGNVTFEIDQYLCGGGQVPSDIEGQEFIADILPACEGDQIDFYTPSPFCGLDSMEVGADYGDFRPYTLTGPEEYWNCQDYDDERTRCFSDETSVGQIFIGDNLDPELRKNCKLEINTGDTYQNVISDTSGAGIKGMLIGDYKIRKDRQGEDMRRSTFTKMPQKSNKRGAL